MKTLSTTFKWGGMLLLFATLIACKKEGCTDPNATNYDPNAKKDDGSCIQPTNNSNNNNNNNTSYTRYLNYTIDGNAVTSANFFLSQTVSSEHQFQGYVGASGSFPDMVIYLDYAIATGSYNITSGFDFSSQVQYLATSNFNDIYKGNGNSGNVTITKHDQSAKIIEGTFSGTLHKSPTDSIVITNGSFGFDYSY